MSKVILRIDQLFCRGHAQEDATLIVIAEQLERIADALEKQNAGNQMVMVNGREISRLLAVRSERL